MPESSAGGVVLDILKVVGLPGFIAWLWAQDRKSFSTSLSTMAEALNLLAEKVGEATEAARGHR